MDMGAEKDQVKVCKPVGRRENSRSTREVLVDRTVPVEQTNKVARVREAVCAVQKQLSLSTNVSPPAVTPTSPVLTVPPPVEPITPLRRTARVPGV